MNTCLHACVLSRFSHVQLFVILWAEALGASLSMGLSRQEYWSALPCPPPGDLPYPGIESMSLQLQADYLLLNWTWNNKLVPNRTECIKAVYRHQVCLTYMQSTSWETLGWMKHKLKSRLPREITVTSDMQMTPLLRQKAKKTKKPLDGSKRRVKKLA